MDRQEIQARFSGKTTRATFLAPEPDRLVFPPHTGAIGMPAAVVLDEGGRRFSLPVKGNDLEDRD